jgi:hypothetical protein
MSTPLASRGYSFNTPLPKKPGIGKDILLRDFLCQEIPGMPPILRDKGIYIIDTLISREGSNGPPPLSTRSG